MLSDIDPDLLAAKVQEIKPLIILSSISTITKVEIQIALRAYRIKYIALDEIQVMKIVSNLVIFNP